MADKPRNPSKPEDKPRKKATEATVQLTAEELRKISGGTVMSGTPPVPKQDVKIK